MKRNRRRRQTMKRRVVVLAMVILSVLCSVLIVKDNSYAQSESTGRTLCYKPVYVQEGDSVWSIARENYTEEWSSTANYVEAILEFNNMTDGYLYSGSYLSIPYYDYITANE